MYGEMVWRLLFVLMFIVICPEPAACVVAVAAVDCAELFVPTSLDPCCVNCAAAGSEAHISAPNARANTMTCAMEDRIERESAVAVPPAHIERVVFMGRRISHS
jgi:hypothetical protein